LCSCRAAFRCCGNGKWSTSCGDSELDWIWCRGGCIRSASRPMAEAQGL
jgi:hypothetical protein